MNLNVEQIRIVLDAGEAANGFSVVWDPWEGWIVTEYEGIPRGQAGASPDIFISGLIFRVKRQYSFVRGSTCLVTILGINRSLGMEIDVKPGIYTFDAHWQGRFPCPYGVAFVIPAGSYVTNDVAICSVSIEREVARV